MRKVTLLTLCLLATTIIARNQERSPLEQRLKNPARVQDKELQDERLLRHNQPQQVEQRRLALVIGNGAYQNVKSLKNPANDAALMAATLKKLGFEVVIGTDKSLVEMKKLIREFGRQLRGGGGVGLFYFAGHGVQSRGFNYLIPVDANIETDADLEDAAVNFNYVLNLMDDAQNSLNIAILDACRNNPFVGRLRSVQEGLAQVKAPTGTLIAYSTAPDQTAADGAGKNSPYTEELISQMQLAGMFIETVFRHVAEKVSSRTGGRQEPWFSANVKGEFCFRPAPNIAGSGSPLPSMVDAIGNPQNQVRRAKDWDLVNKKDCAEIKLFLKEYPGDFEATLFQMRLTCNGSNFVGATAASSPNAERYVSTAIEHYKANDFDQAILDCTEAIKIDPRYAIAYTMRGFAKYEKQNYDQAIVDFTQAIGLNPNDAASLCMRASSYQKIGNHAQAIADSTKSIELNPSEAQPWVIRGASYYYIGSYDQSIIDCIAAIRLNARYEDAYFVRASSQFKKGKLDDAIVDFTAVIELNPQHSHAYFLRGVAYETKEDFHNAILNYTEAVKLRKSYAMVYKQRARCYSKLKNYDNAIADYSEAIRLGINDADIYINRGLAYDNKGDHARAIGDFSESLKLDPKNAQAWLVRGMTYYNKGDYENTVRDCTEAIKLEPDHKEGYEMRALAYEKLGDSQNAEIDRQRVKYLEKKTKP